jgi:hypothetical protein
MDQAKLIPRDGFFVEHSTHTCVECLGTRQVCVLDRLGGTSLAMIPEASMLFAEADWEARDAAQ